MTIHKLSRHAKALAVTGALLFLAGLVQGGAISAFTNPRMALSAHLDAVQSGMALMIAGLFWGYCTFDAKSEAVARWALATGMVGLWLGLTLAALTGASQVLPLAGAGFAAAPLAEMVTAALVLLSSAALAIGWALFALGLIRTRCSP
ncbi:hypothetical protein [Qipengyuania sp.]|uniref:hypothetical protein n=1 Tax=Qipengyuania sp. TaxID=2004515 RepID=UPI0035C79940